ncbi:MAG: sigma 54-interacting transcriptional regulator [Bacteroidetes bacterium]|nr:sigma 54-interacting transcriptional regulator [Bacteroidota bacterium]
MSSQILLSFCTELASVKDAGGLQYILKQYLKQLLGIKGYSLSIRNFTDNTYIPFLHDLPNNPKVLPYPEPTASLLRSDNPIVLPSSSFWRIGIRLHVAGDPVGFLLINTETIDQRLLKGVSAQISIAISNALHIKEIERQKDEIRRHKKYDLPEEPPPCDNNLELIGAGPEMQKIHQAIDQVAFSDSSVLIMGETGTGKELIAASIHTHSNRKDKRIIKVNCAALPADLVESELFGHEKGSFTGAIDRKIGKFELANNSTLFLDEIGELPPDLQVKLLRAIQEREIERIGGKKTIKVDVRIIAATNRDLQKEVSEGRFRGDLFYRLNVFPIFVPALRDRLEDIPLLVNHFIKKLAAKTGKNGTGISVKALNQLIKHNWPGNIRELENCIERSLLMSPQPVIEQVELPSFRGLLSRTLSQAPLDKSLRDNERDHIIAILRKCHGKVGGTGGAAEILDVNTSTLNSKMRKLGIKRGRFITQTEHE